MLVRPRASVTSVTAPPRVYLRQRPLGADASAATPCDYCAYGDCLLVSTTPCDCDCAYAYCDFAYCECDCTYYCPYYCDRTYCDCTYCDCTTPTPTPSSTARRCDSSALRFCHCAALLPFLSIRLRLYWSTKQK